MGLHISNLGLTLGLTLCENYCISVIMYEIVMYTAAHVVLDCMDMITWCENYCISV